MFLDLCRKPSASVRSVFSFQLVVLLGLVTVVVGCRPEDEIKSYEITSNAPVSSAPQGHATSSPPATNVAPPAKVAPVKRGKPTDRMIAAMVKTDDQAWFLKLVGPTDKVDAAEESLDAFFAQLKIESGRPAWELPEGWTEGPERTMRLATLLIPASEGDADKPLEVSVISLPLVGEWSSQVLDNVNRWRKQLGRDPLTASLLEEMTIPLAIAEGSIRFDSTGWMDDGGMSSGGRPPFAGRAPFANQPPVAATPPATQSMANTPVPVGSGELKHTPPEGWADLPGSAMRKASLSTPDGATITAFVFPATAPAMADPLANVNRWRGEVGLAPTTAEKLAESSEKIQLAGSEGTYVELVGPTETTLAAMLPQGSQVWFFKLRGPNVAADAQRDAFKQWLASISL